MDHPAGELVGALPEDEKALLFRELTAVLAFLQKRISIWGVLSVVLLPLVFPVVLLVTYLRLHGRVQKQLSGFRAADTLHVYKLTGTFRRRTSRYGTVTSYRIGHYRVPGSTISANADAVLKSRVHQEMTVEYIGELNYARSCYDAQGKGWSFIRKAAL